MVFGCSDANGFLTAVIVDVHGSSVVYFSVHSAAPYNLRAPCSSYARVCVYKPHQRHQVFGILGVWRSRAVFVFVPGSLRPNAAACAINVGVHHWRSTGSIELCRLPAWPAVRVNADVYTNGRTLRVHVDQRLVELRLYQQLPQRVCCHSDSGVHTPEQLYSWRVIRDCRTHAVR